MYRSGLIVGSRVLRNDRRIKPSVLGSDRRVMCKTSGVTVASRVKPRVRPSGHVLNLVFSLKVTCLTGSSVSMGAAILDQTGSGSFHGNRFDDVTGSSSHNAVALIWTLPSVKIWN